MTASLREIKVYTTVPHRCSYLAGEEAAFVNGAVWLIDGGTLAWRGTLDQLDLG